MNYNDFTMLKLISAIGNLDDNNERVAYYLLNLSYLEDYKMIYVDDKKGTNITERLDKIVNLNYDINSLFASNMLVCFDKQVIENEQMRATTILKYQPSISFDLNIVSQLKYLHNNNEDEILAKIIKLCQSGECAFDIGPFAIENYLKDPQHLGIDELSFEDIKNFESMFSDAKSMSESSDNLELRFTSLKAFYEGEKFAKFAMAFYRNIYLKEYVYLMGIILIQFQYSQASPQQKFEKFIAFCVNNIKAFQPCAANLAMMFYEKTDMRFFRQVQKNNPNIIVSIKNMAWDLFHLRFLEYTYENALSRRDVIVVPMFISKDKGLNEIRKAYQLKCLIQKVRTGECFKFYAMNSLTDNLKEKYFDDKSVKARIDREHDFVNLSKDLENLILAEINQTKKNL